jgi:choline dehydrogenase-like flavoprotein
MSASPDIVIIGSGIGGATMAAGLAASGAEIVILEAGDRLPDRPENRDQRAIFQRGFFRPKENWYEASGAPFNPGNYYNVGGNSKFYGAVLVRFRREDFGEIEHLGGLSPAWPFPYEELEPWYSRAEALFQVRGELGDDPTEPWHSQPYLYPAVPEEAPIAKVRARLRAVGVHPASLPLGIDIERWLSKGKTPWDAHPNADDGKMDAETGPLREALRHPNVRLVTGATVRRLVAGPDGRDIAAVEYDHHGERKTVRPKLVILSAGAVRSAALLLASGLANRSDQVGRNFMNHNASAVIAISPTFHNDAVYQKTFGFNDFYLQGGERDLPLGNVQLLGRVSGKILKASMPAVPEAVLDLMSRHAVDFYAMSEDLPVPQSRVRLDDERIVLEWQRTNVAAHEQLVARLKATLCAAGFPLVLSRPFDKRTPSHQCGTIRMGTDPGTSPLDPHCRAWDHPNLYVVDAGFLPSSAAVNPALTIAAQALRVADHITRTELRSGSIAAAPRANA